MSLVHVWSSLRLILLVLVSYMQSRAQHVDRSSSTTSTTVYGNSMQSTYAYAEFLLIFPSTHGEHPREAYERRANAIFQEVWFLKKARIFRMLSLATPSSQCLILTYRRRIHGNTAPRRLVRSSCAAVIAYRTDMSRGVRLRDVLGSR